MRPVGRIFGLALAANFDGGLGLGAGHRRRQRDRRPDGLGLSQPRGGHADDADGGEGGACTAQVEAGGAQVEAGGAQVGRGHGSHTLQDVPGTARFPRAPPSLGTCDRLGCRRCPPRGVGHQAGGDGERLGVTEPEHRPFDAAMK